jgi:hypothetical protein
MSTMSTEQTQRARREAADRVEYRRKIEKHLRIQNGTEPSLAERGRVLAEGIVTGLLLGSFVRSIRNR